MSKEHKERIQQRINAFATGNLADNAIALFKELGYESNRRIALDKGACEGLFAEHQTADAQKALIGDWKSADYLFQLTENEISKQKSLFSVNHYTPEEYQSYSFLAIELKNEYYARGKLSQITREVNKLFPMPVMILFKHGNTLTLSIINRRLHKRDESKDIMEKVTLIKDIKSPITHTNQFPLNKGGEGDVTHRAHIEILFDLSFDELKNKHGFTNFVELHNAWQKTLDTSELNKKFYREIANWYFWAIKNVEFPADEEKDKDIRNAINVIRLITRLFFVWFLKEKGLVRDELFNQQKLAQLLSFEDKNKSTYYKAILQNLFFATLNTEMNKDTPGSRKFRHKAREPGQRDQHYMIHNIFRYEDYFINPLDTLKKYFDNIPFLNGGLFECLDKKAAINSKDKVIRVDGFSDHPENIFKVPDELFFSPEQQIDLNEIYGTRNKTYKVRGLIDILNSYKFTVHENTPIEEEVALDPELLGKVFENLLASYNPETRTTARKLTGSFYSPREIVNHMVDESLIAYLQTQLIQKLPKLDKEGEERIEAKLRHLFS